ncbi:McrB family protein [Massilia sp. BKSP1R2A-1]|uniref:McrB family protein n=1 Tax=Massilia sp. BKSP1R2A-1 TaxID=3422595 RepID=UPI003D325155
MTEQELAALVAEAAGVSAEDVEAKIRDGTQIKANALWEGSCTPARARRPAGIFLARSREDIAVEGAQRRMTLPIKFPDSAIVLGSDLTNRRAAVVGYPDSRYAAGLADGLGVQVSTVQHPVIATRPARSEGQLRPDAESRRLEVQQLRINLGETPNIVLQGPPGTGKSSLALALVEALATEGASTAEGCRYGRLLQGTDGTDTARWLEPPVVWEFVQLHPSYSYDDLVRRVVPKTQDGNIRLMTEDGLLPRLCKIADLRGPDKPVLLILDEMNRGNLAAILGEFVFAIDPPHRGTAVRLQYQGPGLATAVAVPRNLWIIGTMNTADRSIAMVDYAIRRRFRFLEVPSDARVLAQRFGADQVRAGLTQELFSACNQGLPPRLQIGHAAFLENPEPRDTWPERMGRRIAFHILPLLSEYVKEGLRDESPVAFRDIQLSLDARRSEARRLAAAIRAVLEETT